MLCNKPILDGSWGIRLLVHSSLLWSEAIKFMFFKKKVKESKQLYKSVRPKQYYTT